MARRSIRDLELVVKINMQIKFDSSALGKTKWHEYAIRFILGGSITAVAGFIAKKFGPGIGGLFLAFPAIFPAGATLIEKHEKQRKAEQGLQGTKRARYAASVDAAGSSMGSIGLLVFAVLSWRFIPRHNALSVLAGSTLVWLGVSVLVWLVRKRT